MAITGTIRNDNWIIKVPVAETYSVMHASQILGRSGVTLRDVIQKGKLDVVFVEGRQHVTHDSVVEVMGAADQRAAARVQAKADKAVAAEARKVERAERAEAKKVAKVAAEAERAAAREAAIAAKEAAKAAAAEALKAD